MSDTSNHFSPTVIVSLIGFFGIIASAVLGFFGGRNSAIAQLQLSINQGFKELNDASRDEIAAQKYKIAALEGEIRQLRQYNNSLVSWLRQHGLDVPPQPEVAVVFAPFPGDDHA